MTLTISSTPLQQEKKKKHKNSKDKEDKGGCRMLRKSENSICSRDASDAANKGYQHSCTASQKAHSKLNMHIQHILFHLLKEKMQETLSKD